ncbi:hypothetical protein QQF64_015778 [Cirrhinus molitorella]|uniref:Uncharacterized protein n=1 Tax=Cirrhinus molitorella TaxID=172907 RepID=A0ABR3NVV6_9TELE
MRFQRDASPSVRAELAKLQRETRRTRLSPAPADSSPRQRSDRGFAGRTVGSSALVRVSERRIKPTGRSDKARPDKFHLWTASSRSLRGFELCVRTTAFYHLFCGIKDFYVKQNVHLRHTTADATHLTQTQRLD